MWLILTLASMLICTFSEIFAKKHVLTDENNGPVKLRICSSVVVVLLVPLFYALGLSESGLLPWEILKEHPAIILMTSCTFMCTFCLVLSFRFIGVTMESAVSSTSAVFLFAGMLLVNLFFGKLEDIRGTLVPAKLLPIVIIILALFLLPNADGIGRDRSPNADKAAARKRIVIGILIVLLSNFFDVSDSIIAAVLLTDTDVGVFDTIISGALVSGFYSLLLYIGSWAKHKKPLHLLSRSNRYCFVYAILSILCIVVSLIAYAYDAVSSAILWLSYPVLPIIASALILKERYSKRQYLCIAVIIAASLVFCIADYLP
ncbi:MAG: hypothetical protein HUJ66_02505 [Oscillospiraceae bacterium]|nr:hypothetical protein [Oscillospiraceae bacterium]